MRKFSLLTILLFPLFLHAADTVRPKRVAFLEPTGGAVTANEQAARQFFIDGWGADNIINASQISDDYQCIWVNVDRDLTPVGDSGSRLAQQDGYRKLPAPFDTDDFYTAIQGYIKRGGNVYFSGQAVQIINAGTNPRIDDADRPHVLYGEYGESQQLADGNEWTVRPLTDDDNVFLGLAHSGRSDYGALTYAMQSDGQTIYDHNTMWQLGKWNTATVSTTAAFCNKYNADIIGGWGQQDDDGVFGLVRFRPQGDWQGTIYCNGIAACQSWTPIEGQNRYHNNLMQLTYNILNTLSPDDEYVDVEVGIHGLNTFCCSKAIDFTTAQRIHPYIAVARPAGTGALAPDDDMTNIIMQRVAITAAGEGMLLRSVNGTNDRERLPVYRPGTVTRTQTNLFVATTQTIQTLPTVDTDGRRNYILNVVDGVIAFYPAAGQAVPKGRAYLAIAAQAARISCTWQTQPTAITPMTASHSALRAHNLLGQTAATSARGIVIVAGRAFVK